MVAKTKTAVPGVAGSRSTEKLLDVLSEKIARDIYNTIVLSKGIAEINKKKGLSGKKIDKFFESMLD